MSLKVFFRQVILSCAIFGTTKAFSQTANVDSLKSIVDKNFVDSAWFEAIYRLSEQHAGLLDDGIRRTYAKRMLRAATEQNDTFNMTRGNEELANFYKERNEFDSAVYHALIAHALSENLADKSLTTSLLCDISRLHFIQNDYQLSLETAEEGLRLVERYDGIDETKKVCIYGQLGTTYSYMARYSEANKFFQKAIQVLEGLENPNLNQLSSTYNNMGANYFFMGDFNKAIEWYTVGMNIIEKNPEVDQLYVSLINIGEAYTYLGNFIVAEDYLKRGQRQAEEAKDRYVVSSALYMLTEMYEKKGDARKALEHYKMYVAVKDSLFSLEKAKQITAMQALYETEKKERDILQLQQEKQAASIEIERQKTQNLLFAGVALLFVLISGGTIFGYLQVRRAKQEVDRRNALITDINRRLNASQDALMISNKTKDKFFALIAHDLRGPVTSLSGIGKLLNFNLRKGRIQKVEELIGQIDSSSSVVNHLLDNLLKWALSQTGALTYRSSQVNTRALIQDCLAVFDETARAKSITIDTSTSGGDLIANADYNMLSTVLRNLIGNALKFTPAGGMVKISGELKENEIEISVSDSGPGMPDSVIRQIAKKEPLESSPGSEGEKGSGLGLILCNEFVQLHGSTLVITASPQTGTKVCFKLIASKQLEEV